METLETLAGGSVLYDPPKAQIPEVETLKRESGAFGLSGSSDRRILLGLSPLARVEDSGVKVSDGENEVEGTRVSVPGDKSIAEVEETRVVELVDNIKNGGMDDEMAKNSSADEGVTSDTLRTEGSLELQEKGKELGLLDDTGRKNIDINVSVFSEDEKKQADKSTVREGTSWKIEVSGNDIPLVVEVHGSASITNQDDNGEAKRFGLSTKKVNPNAEIEVRERRNSYKQNGDSSAPVNGKNPVAKVTETPKSTSEMTKSQPMEEDERKESFEVDNEEDSEEDEEEMDDEDHKFSVGDFVWGKIKCHPWWPGRIYDPLYASKCAAKYHRRDRFLVAYFGDGTFAWCYPSQLKPFNQYFGSMSKQSNSGSFVKAVEKALDEIGRCVELETICSCVPGEALTELTWPLAVNAGIKEGVAVPDGGIDEFSVARFEPAKFLARLRDTAVVVSMTSMLELELSRSRLSAFYRAKGHHLPKYYEPDEVVDPEDNAGNGIVEKSDFDVQTEDVIAIPVEDWLSSSVGPSSPRWPGISEDKLYQRKKQKSMVEILGGCMDVEPGDFDNDGAEEVTVSGKMASTFRKKKRSKDPEVGNGFDQAEEGPSPSKKGRKIKLSGSPTTIENKVSSDEKDDDGIKEETEKENKKGSASRERKKSKYLSPPYTNLGRVNKSLISSRGSEMKSSKRRNDSHIGERMRRAAGQLVSSPPIVKCSGETFQKEVSKESDIGYNTSCSISPRTPKRNQSVNVPEEINVPADELLSEFHSIAINVLCLRGKGSFAVFISFFSSFRNSLYRDGSNHEMYHEHIAGQDGRKRNSSDEKPSSLGENLQVTGHSLVAQADTEQKKRKGKSSDEKLSSLGENLRVTGHSLVAQDDTEQKKRKRKSSDDKPSLMGENFRVTGHSLAHGGTEQKKRKRKSSGDKPSSLGEDLQVPDHSLAQGDTEPKKSSEDKTSSLGENLQVTSQSLAQGGTEQKKTKRKSSEDKPSSLVEHVQVTGHTLAQGGTEQKKRKRKSSEDKPCSLGEHLHVTDQSLARGGTEQKKRQGKSSEAKPNSLGEHLQVTDPSFAHGCTEQKKRKRKEKAMPEAPKIEINPAAAVSLDAKRSKNKETNRKVRQAALLLTFVPGFLPLPSIVDLNRLFGQFGILNEFETELFPDSGCARVVYVRSSDAEAAFNSLGKGIPFGPSVVSYRLQYLSAIATPSRASEFDGNTHQQPPTTPHVEGGKTLAVSSASPRLPDGEAPPLVLMRQNLQMMTSMLEKSGDKLSPEVKANLENEIKGLLKKVSTMVESSSS